MTFHIKHRGEGGGWEEGWLWRTSFSRYWSLKFMPEKLIFHNMTSVSKFYMAYRSPNGTCTFPHSYAASFSIKLVSCETNNLFLAENIKFGTKLQTCPKLQNNTFKKCTRMSQNVPRLNFTL